MSIYRIKQDDETWREYRLISQPIDRTMLAYSQRVEMFKGKFHDEDINPEEIWEEVKNER